VIALENLFVRNGSFLLDGINLTIPTGRYGVLMGKTGCGKTTVLEVICGLKPAFSGVVRLMGRDVTGLKAAERGIGYVPQDATLFTTMTVRKHLGFALFLRRWPRKEIEGRVSELAELLGLGRLLDRRPLGLSGGETQRVALGRALAFSPNILCLDEPLSSLDYETRKEMCALLKTVQKRTGVTTIHVTHDLNEARELSDTFCRFVDGKIQEVTDLESL